MSAQQGSNRASAVNLAAILFGLLGFAFVVGGALIIFRVTNNFIAELGEQQLAVQQVSLQLLHAYQLLDFTLIAIGISFLLIALLVKD